MSGLRIAEALISCGFFGAVVWLGRQQDIYVNVLSAYRHITTRANRRRESSDWYSNTKKWLLRNGAAYHLGYFKEPTRFLSLRLFFLLAAVVLAGNYGLWVVFPAAVVGFYLPVMLLHRMNRRDNEKILPELKLVYHALEIQIQAGVYITDALAECYASVSEKRLRDALLDLASDIVMRADTGKSLSEFQRKFDNRHIDALCITIMQALESGQAVELLRDIGEQLKDMESAVMERRRTSMDRMFTFCQLGILTVVMGIALFICVNYMLGTASMF